MSQDGFTVEPGIVPTAQWRPAVGLGQGEDPAYAAVGRKR
jgi:hypothetical protein